MRVPTPTSTAFVALLAAAIPFASALAEDAAHVPGGDRTGQNFSLRANDTPSAPPAAVQPAIAAAPVAAPAGAPIAASGLGDVDRLLVEAEAAMRVHRMAQAEAALERAETRMLNARDAGMSLPDRAFAQLVAARGDLNHGDAPAARQAISEVRHMLRRT